MIQLLQNEQKARKSLVITHVSLVAVLWYNQYSKKTNGGNEYGKHHHPKSGKAVPFAG